MIVNSIACVLHFVAIFIPSGTQLWRPFVALDMVITFPYSSSIFSLHEKERKFVCLMFFFSVVLVHVYITPHKLGFGIDLFRTSQAWKPYCRLVSHLQSSAQVLQHRTWSITRGIHRFHC